MPSQSQTKTKLVAHPGASGGLSPAPPAAACLLFTITRGWKRGPGKVGALPTAGRQGGGRGAARRLLPIWEPPPDLRSACPRLPLSAGKRRGTARCRLGEARLRVRVRPSEVALPGSLETAHPARRSGLGAVALQSGGNCVSGCLGAGGARMQGKGGCQGARSRGCRKGWGTGLRRVPRRGGLTPPPARPGGGDSSHRAPRAGRGRGRGRRRRRQPERRGRRRTSGNP